MTAQIGEKLRYEGRELAMSSQPLDDYFASTGVRPQFISVSTALGRGYVGTWEIQDDRLYLIGLTGRLLDRSRASLARFFPDQPDRVFANWFSGKLRVPQGKVLKYIHMGYASIHESDLFISIEQGVLKETWVKHNSSPAAEGVPEGQDPGGMSAFE